MRKKVFIFAMTFSLLIIMAGCTSQTNGDPKDLEIAQLQEQISSYENDIAQLKEEKENYKKFIDSSIKYLDENELSALAKNCWRYEISVVDAPMNFKDAYKIEKSNFKITYSERVNNLSTSEEGLFDNGNISGNFYDHLAFIDIQPTKTYITDGTVVQGMNYEFENVTKGSVIKMEVTDELKERLELEENVITIEVN
ncbi:MAG: hypothetical protein AB7E42_04080 [Anaerotignaceae bacterium]